ncbi:Fcf2-domain-containing protein [Xylariaceae sp. FL0016]|nr:Fcf2-domain-containing protein [Xylariaceae sp. FL0016]
MESTTALRLTEQDIEDLLSQAESRLLAKQQNTTSKSLALPSKSDVVKTGKPEPAAPNSVPATTAASSSKKEETHSVRIPEPHRSKKQKTQKADAGERWFNMPRTDLTPELRRDLQLLRSRDVLDPKRHYKKDTLKVPEYSQVGTIVAGPTDFFNSRLTKKERKRTLLEEVLENEDSTRRFKSKYGEIQATKTSGKKGHYKKMMEKRYGRTNKR